MNSVWTLMNRIEEGKELVRDVYYEKIGTYPSEYFVEEFPHRAKKLLNESQWYRYSQLVRHYNYDENEYRKLTEYAVTMVLNYLKYKQTKKL